MSAGCADGDWVLGKDSLGGGGEVIDLSWGNNKDNKAGNTATLLSKRVFI